MILILGDTHCQYPVINDQIEFAEQKTGRPVKCVIQLGDFGIYQNELKKYFELFPDGFIRPLYFIDGNHEDFWHFDTIIKKYEHKFTYLPRGSYHQIEGYNFLVLGGAAYMDPINTPPGAIITSSDLEKSLFHKKKKVDIILSHDCPKGIGVPGTVGFEYCGSTGFEGSNQLFQCYKPKLWFFGHYHKWFYANTETTSYYGLDVSYNGLILLDDNFNVKIIKNSIRKHYGLSQRFYGKEDHLWPSYKYRKWQVIIKKISRKIKSQLSRIKLNSLM
jgi:predicted phosphodiesterase